MVASQKSRYHKRAGKRIQEVRVLITYPIGHGRVNLLDKVVVVAMQLVRVDTHNRPYAPFSKLG